MFMVGWFRTSVRCLQARRRRPEPSIGHRHDAPMTHRHYSIINAQIFPPSHPNKKVFFCIYSSSFGSVMAPDNVRAGRQRFPRIQRDSAALRAKEAALASLRFHHHPAGAAPSKTPLCKSSARTCQRKCRLQRAARRSRHISLRSGPSTFCVSLWRERLFASSD